MPSDRVFDDEAPEPDVLEQLIPVDDEDDAVRSLARVRLSPDAEADEADLLEQAIDVPLDDDLDLDR